MEKSIIEIESKIENIVNLNDNTTANANANDTPHQGNSTSITGKSKLKSLFDEIDNSKKKKGKTQPTKPKFKQMNVDIPGLGKSSYSTTGFKGLTNFGNICYSNVVMQCLISLKEFANMLNIIFKKIEEQDEIEKYYPVFYNLVKILQYYKSIIFNLFMYFSQKYKSCFKSYKIYRKYV
jgi:ubiquitin C-terminal hydrolase